MADLMPKKNYDLTEITRLLLEMRENCIPKAGDVYEDPNRTEKYDALNAAIDLINSPSMISRWISVKDRLPNEEIDVLMRFEQNMAVGFRLECDWYAYTDDGYYTSCDSKPTHWMPLPEPPKEG